MRKILISIVLATILLSFYNLVFANTISDTINQIGNQTGLTNYEGASHVEAIDQKGVRNITSGLFYVLDFGKYVLGSIAIIIIIYMGLKMVVSSDADASLEGAKKFFTSALIGIFLILLADIIVQKVFFGQAGEVLLTEESAKQAALAGSEEIRGIYTFVEMFLAAIAVLTIVISGIRMMLSTQETSAQVKHIMYACVGLLIVGISELVVKDIIFADYGTRIDVEAAKNLVASITNFISSFIAMVSVAAFVYAGYLYTASYIAGDNLEKAKKAMIGAIAGILIAAAGFSITKTLLDFKDTADEVVIENEK
jgi:hypothetical protein